MVLLRKKLENINLKYEKILRIINTIFNILWVLVYSIYFIISFYLLDFQLSYVFDFLQILLGFIFIFNCKAIGPNIIHLRQEQMRQNRSFMLSTCSLILRELDCT